MPLPAPTPREEIHLRRIEMRGYRREDGLYDIEARLTDTKAMSFELPEKTLSPGEPVHDMWLRVVVDQDMTVRDVIATTDASPYRPCPEAARSLAAIKGLRIGAGWSRAVKERLRRADNCTHLVELLVPLATTAYQTIGPMRQCEPEVLDANGRPVKIDSCYAYSSERELVLQRWPRFYKSSKTADSGNT